MEQKIYYEDYELGSTRTTIGRTITEADIVLHAGQTGGFLPSSYGCRICKNNRIREKDRPWNF